MRIGRRAAMVSSISLAAGSGGRIARSQEGWPGRPVRLVVAYPAGGSTDIVGRLLAERLSRAWSQPVVVENRGGASGTLGADLVAKSPPDGATLLLGASSEMAIAQTTLRSLPYDPGRDFEAISLLTLQPFLLLVNPALPARDVAELTALARLRPGGLNFGSYGTGTSTHLMGEMLRVGTGAAVTHVPYRGSAPAITDLIGGQIQLLFDTIPAALPHLREGRLRALALCHERRLASVPEVRTTAEAGQSGLVGATWAALVAPAGTPPPLVRRIAADAQAAMRGGLAEVLLDRGLEPVGASPEETRAFFATEIRKWAEVARRAGIRPE